MTPEERDEKLKELEDRLEEFSQKLEEAELEGNDELVEMSEEYIEIRTDYPNKKQVVHYISIDETSSFESDCSNIEDSKDAEKAFKEASEYRDDGEKRTFEHGDILILECQGEKPSDSGSETEPDGCYYIGICSVIEEFQQEEDPYSVLESQTHNSKTIKNFMAWSTCGGSDNFAFEKPEDIDSVLCKDEEDNTVGIKLLFEDENQSGEPLSQNAFVPLLPPNVSCPTNGDFIYLKGVTITKENYPSGTGQHRLKIVKEFRKMTFAGGVLVSQETPSSSELGHSADPQYIGLGVQYDNEELIEICRDGSPHQIYVPYRDASSS